MPGTPRTLIGIAVAAIYLAMLLSSSVVAQDAPAFIVLYGTNAIPTNASAAIASSGGTVVAAYDAIGVVVARSASATFRTQMLTQTGVVGVSATAGLGVQLRSAADQDNTAAPTSTPASDSDTLSSLQWDMRQIHTPEAHAITGGSPTVVVGDLDSGLDYTHPDLAPNVDFGNSVS